MVFVLENSVASSTACHHPFPPFSSPFLSFFVSKFFPTKHCVPGVCVGAWSLENPVKSRFLGFIVCLCDKLCNWWVQNIFFCVVFLPSFIFFQHLSSGKTSLTLSTILSQNTWCLSSLLSLLILFRQTTPNKLIWDLQVVSAEALKTI